MDRIAHVTHQPDKFGTGKPGFKDGDPTSGTVATIPGAVSFDSYQEEILGAIEGAGITPSAADYTQLLQAIRSLIAQTQGGINTGRFEYASVSTVALTRQYRGVISVDVDGTIFKVSASDVTFDLAAHLDTGSEAASTWYYCYLANVAGVLTPKISVTAPAVSAPAKVGYHPTNLGWRYIGAFFNDASSNVTEFDQRGSETQLRYLQDARFQINIGTSITGTYVAIDLAGTIPVTARMVLIASFVHGDSFYPGYVAEAQIGQNVAAHPPLHGNAGNNDVEYGLTPPGNTHGGNGVVEFWLPVDSTPRIGYGMAGSVENILDHRINIIGWRE